LQLKLAFSLCIAVLFGESFAKLASKASSSTFSWPQGSVRVQVSSRVREARAHTFSIWAKVREDSAYFACCVEVNSRSTSMHLGSSPDKKCCQECKKLIQKGPYEKLTKTQMLLTYPISAANIPEKSQGWLDACDLQKMQTCC
jgi:hypothetical protein